MYVIQFTIFKKIKIWKETLRVVLDMGHLLCGLVVRVPDFKTRGSGSISSATRYSENWWFWNGVHSLS
jgi:hypothetical protein